MSLNLPDLPVLSALPGLCEALRAPGCAVLCAPPGSGKTTLVPLSLLDQSWLNGRRIVMLEPRRVAARMAAARMAQLLGERVGRRVGYHIRFERRVSDATRIEVVTEGLLARRLQAQPELPGVGLLIFDEFHERSLDADLALALALEAREALNPELRMLVMSATLDAQRVAALLGGAPVVQAGGRQYPVDIRQQTLPADLPLGEAVARGCVTALGETDGDILAFLPGAREIRDAQRTLQARAASVTVHPLYGELSSDQQDAALQPAADGARKIILATNIAQTSLTVEGVTTVVDGGWVRVARFDLGAGANRLDTVRVSRASAEQRAGRAGRLCPGVCYRLWSSEQHGFLPAHDTPEIASADLTRFALELAAWGVADPAAVTLMDQPPEVTWNYARELLTALGALQSGGGITRHGRELRRLPLHPRIGHMLLTARDHGLGEDAAWIAAVLEHGASGSVDLDALVRQFQQGRGEPQVQRRVNDAVTQLCRLLADRDKPSPVSRLPSSGDEAATGRIVAWAFPERLARARRGQPGVFLCADGGEARVGAGDPLAHAPWLAIAHWDPRPPRRVRLAAAMTEGDVLADHDRRIVDTDVVGWSTQTQAVVAETRRQLGAIVLSARPLRSLPGEAQRRAMLDGIAQMGLATLPWDDTAREWQARVLSLRAWRPDENWPDVSDRGLQHTTDQWLAPWLDGVTRREHLARLDLTAILSVMLDHRQQQSLARLTPTHVDVPSGSRVRLTYDAGAGPPVLAVKLQELFGLSGTPCVNDGRTPVMLHLLSPARRPIQVTQDLASFWRNTYPEVKKELKGRYPKHPWPDDPMTAPPTARTRRAGRPIRP